MASGIFEKSVGAVRPGTYVNFVGKKQASVVGATRGTVLLPLTTTDYGPAKKFIKLTAESPDACRALLGHSIYDDHPAMLMIREAFKGANSVIVFILAEGKTAATGTGGGITGTAKYKGTLGNKLTYSIVANPVEGFDVEVSMNGVKLESYEGVTSVADLSGSQYITFAANGEASMAAIAGVTLEGGEDTESTNADVTAFLDGAEGQTFDTLCFPFEDEELHAALKTKVKYITFAANGEASMAAIAGVTLTGGEDAESTNADVTAFLDGAEGQTFDTLCFPFEDEELHAALKTKVKYIRDTIGKPIQAVAPNFAADYEGIINVTNSYALDDKELTIAQACAFVAGVTAGASKTTSNTYRTVDGATAIVGVKSHKEAVTAIQNGELFFSISEAGNVVIEYDINSMVTIPANRDESYRKNRVQRVFAEWQKAIQLNFPPNKFNNNDEGWEIMEGIGRTLLKQFGPTSEGGDGALQNIDYDNDFKVDRTNSQGDATYFDCGIQAVDSAEKLYFTVATR